MGQRSPPHVCFAHRVNVLGTQYTARHFLQYFVRQYCPFGLSIGFTFVVLFFPSEPVKLGVYRREEHLAVLVLSV